MTNASPPPPDATHAGGACGSGEAVHLSRIDALEDANPLPHSPGCVGARSEAQAEAAAEGKCN